MQPEKITSDAAEAVVIPWPEGVARVVGASTGHLQRQRAAGDHPKLYAVTERVLVTTGADLLDWIQSKAIPPGYKCREPVMARRHRGQGGAA